MAKQKTEKLNPIPDVDVQIIKDKMRQDMQALQEQLKKLQHEQQLGRRTIHDKFIFVYLESEIGRLALQLRD